MDIIIQPIATHLARYDQLFGSCVEQTDGLLRMALNHLLQQRGKMMRPKLMMLCAAGCGQVNDAVLHAAVAVEMLHTATLVHDDVVDDSPLRRGQQSVNAMMGDKAAVLVGDYLLSTALMHAAQAHSHIVNSRLAWLGQALAEGELLQMECTRDNIVSEEAYRKVITHKTASLFSVCAELGAVLAGADDDMVRHAADMGRSIGIAFQIRDDIFDYSSSDSVGKPTAGADMREGKLTLPAIHAVKTHPELLPLALKVRALEASPDEIEQLLDASRLYGMDYTRQAMQAEAQLALSHSSVFSPDVQASLSALIDLVAQRSV